MRVSINQWQPTIRLQRWQWQIRKDLEHQLDWKPCQERRCIESYHHQALDDCTRLRRSTVVLRWLPELLLTLMLLYNRLRHQIRWHKHHWGVVIHLCTIDCPILSSEKAANINRSIDRSIQSTLIKPSYHYHYQCHVRFWHAMMPHVSGACG
jgi:hypothetical protein